MYKEQLMDRYMRGDEIIGVVDVGTGFVCISPPVSRSYDPNCITEPEDIATDLINALPGNSSLNTA
jgi:hypothetical protein